VTAVAGKVCVVTGAGSGIGRALAIELARRGARAVAISDVDQAGLARTAAALEATGTDVHAGPLDVADRAAFAAYALAVAGRFGVVHQIYNNAGVGGQNRILDADYDQAERVIGINLWGVIHGTTEFLPHLIASGDGHVINVSSLNGYVGQATISAYCASKFGVRGFTESVRAEVLRDRHPVQVSCVHPGGVKTAIATNAARSAGRPLTAADLERVRIYNEKLLRMDPARAAAIIVGGVERNKARIRVGGDAVLADVIVRLMPARYPRLAAMLDRLVTR
jgi:NAD(P)-dependent dehydrogenase (short-subunit alcohol dehydrogenase family)